MIEFCLVKRYMSNINYDSLSSRGRGVWSINTSTVTKLSIYSLYYQCLERGKDNLRSKCVNFFVEYHRYKFIHYFDVQGYIKFIVDVFFDPSFEVFNNMSSFKCRAHNPTIKHIYNRIINDKRKLNEEDHQLKKRIEIYQECSFGYMSSLGFNSNDFYEKVSVKKDQNDKKNQEQINQNDEVQLKKNTITDSDPTFINKDSRYILQDILLERIISFLVVNLPTFDIEQSDVEIVLNMALVSKKIFKIVSKYIPNGYYLRGPANLQSEHCFVQSPPRFFDYNSIKYIKYGESTDRTNQLFERVEEFHINSDEYDWDSKNVVERAYIGDQTFAYDNELSFYLDSLFLDGYLTHLPAMPKLKHITVRRYYGFKSNYSSLLTSILESTPNGNGHGIESFNIKIYKDSIAKPNFSNLDFLVPLLRLHSNTLKSVEIRYIDSCFENDIKELLQKLKNFIATLEKHSFSFILRANYQRLERVCRDDQDRKIYQYLLNHKIKNNIPDGIESDDFL
ncbi:hypothetical protein PPL_09392 [Heterostelium album PN500]|uniref:Uncharacterized protein n=1 Tax=Heterostelium pallidum (strain ATCC 26659 / Pp 5 / PN500) TaxID=670386 RepID=D3BLF8_HETP5|nr:hypothetical protein PPL_09392 [Heterostelium album PN500]EFA77892.1 hypothetical protein PPL_09392 [Heterostelium album PN500]|eukprot:XP_020430020.1 hypothetical protein PPL_09392 [Heterostelium album PN500]